jgi:RNA polymerase sigma-70 factor, ECF subfamily
LTKATPVTQTFNSDEEDVARDEPCREIQTSSDHFVRFRKNSLPTLRRFLLSSNTHEMFQRSAVSSMDHRFMQHPSLSPDSSTLIRTELGALPVVPRSANPRAVEIVENCRDYLLMAANRAVGGELRVKVPPSDLVQETVMAAIDGFDQFRGTTERELLAWLTRILSFRIIDAARQFQRQKVDLRREVSISAESSEVELALLQSDGSPSAFLMAEEDERQLLDAMSKLSAESAELIRLRHWEDLSFNEIARRLGMSESGVRKRWSSAICELREYIEK